MSSWQLEPVADVEGVEAPAPTVVSLHFLRSALRRRWRVWAIFGVVGLLLAIAYTVKVPPKTSAEVTLLMAHDPSEDPARAMQTDVSLLETRSVAQEVIDDLHLAMTPEEFQKTVFATIVTDQVLRIDVTGPDAASAVSRAKTLANDFLAFRAKQSEDQTNVLVKGYQSRIDDLNDRINQLNQQYDELYRTDPSKASDIGSLSYQLSSQVSSLQQTIQNTTLEATYIQDSTHVLDPASVNPHGTKKRVVLNVASGVIGGLAVGIGIVLFFALTSERLRRRGDVATAIGVPVRASVRKLRRGGVLRRLLPRRWTLRRRELDVLLHTLESPLEQAPRRTRLALAAVDSGTDAQLAVAALAARLHASGTKVFVVDLSERGRLSRAVRRAVAKEPKPAGKPLAAPVVFRPEGVPSLAQGPLGVPRTAKLALPAGDPRRSAWDDATVVLTLAEVDPSLGAEHLTSWADRAVLIVTAGGSSAERLRTTAELMRAADMNLLFGVLLGSDKTDESSGLPEPGDEGAANLARSSSG